jgi:ketosteroid isomerase-like protein
MNYEQMLRTAYATFATGDLEGYLELCTPDVTFVIPGRNPLARTYDRETFKTGLIADVMRLSAGSFRETVLDVFTSARGGAVHAHHEFVRDGQSHAYRTLHLYEFRDGKLASFREVPEDLHAFDAAWA